MKLVLYLTVLFGVMGNFPFAEKSYASGFLADFPTRSMSGPNTDNRFCSIAYAPGQYLDSGNVDKADTLVVKADSLVGDLMDGEEEISLVGDVVISRGKRQLSSEEIMINRPQNIASFKTPLTLAGPNMRLDGERGDVSLDLQSFQLADVQFVFQESGFRGQATRISKKNRTMNLSNVQLTRCETLDASWALSTEKLSIDESQSLATARGVRMDLQGIPIFYMPYLRFPAGTKRASGWLFPDLSHGKYEGLDVSLPYYLNLSSNYDATIIPRIRTRRGFGGDIEFRHANRFGRTVINGSILTKDQYIRSNNGLMSDARETTHSDENRWLGKIRHEGRSGPWSTLIDASVLSDNDYFLDQGAIDYDGSLTSFVERRAEIQYRNNGLTAWIQAQNFVDLTGSAKTYGRSPDLGIRYSRPIGRAYFNIGSYWTRFNGTLRSEVGEFNRVPARRLHLEPQIQLPFVRNWGFITATGGLRHTKYVLENNSQPLDLSPTRSMGFASLEGGLFFEREASYLGNTFRQTLEPRIFYLRQTFEEQQALPEFDVSRLQFHFDNLFGGNYFSGLDRIGDANRLSLGISTRFLSEKFGSEVAQFDLGTIIHRRTPRIRYLKDHHKSYLLANKSFVGQMQLKWSSTLGMDSVLAWDSSDARLGEVGFGVRWRPSDEALLRAGYRKVLRDQINQTDVAIKWPLNSRWRLIGKWNYDWESDSEIESFAGFEYESCCVKVRTLWRQFLRVPPGNDMTQLALEQGIVLQFVFKGLAGFGSKLDNVIDRGFGGFQRTNWSAHYDYF